MPPCPSGQEPSGAAHPGRKYFRGTRGEHQAKTGHRALASPLRETHEQKEELPNARRAHMDTGRTSMAAVMERRSRPQQRFHILISGQEILPISTRKIIQSLKRWKASPTQTAAFQREAGRPQTLGKNTAAASRAKKPEVSNPWPAFFLAPPAGWIPSISGFERCSCMLIPSSCNMNLRPSRDCGVPRPTSNCCLCLQRQHSSHSN